MGSKLVVMVTRGCGTSVWLPFPVGQVQHDNGQEYGASFPWHLIDKRIGHVRIKPRTPRLNGKVERSHRIDSEEF